MALRILVIEDESDARALIESYLDNESFIITMMENGAAAKEYLKKEQVDIVLTDVRMPGITGEELVPYIHKLKPEIPIVVMTGYGSVDGAVHFLRFGAFDYITKPFTREVLCHRLHLAARQVELSREVDKLKNTVQRDELTSILGTHPSMLRITSMLPSVAKTDASILVFGESGTGKEMIARSIHDLSKRSNNKFVALNCGALPEQLLESELFGYKKGAFTDAKQDHPGLVDEANMGTLFLDEVGEMSMQIQVKFLRFLQEKEYRPIGSTSTKKADVRIVSATNQDLFKRVKEGLFREDLYYRLNVIPLQLPPLRERRSDIPILVDHYMKLFAREYDRTITGISPDLMTALMSYEWPGNIRELINTVQRLVIMATKPELDLSIMENISFMGELKKITAAADLIPSLGDNKTEARPLALGPFKEEKERVVTNFERRYIIKSLEQAHGNISAAARQAQMDRKNFWQLMKKYAIEASPAT